MSTKPGQAHWDKHVTDQTVSLVIKPPLNQLLFIEYAIKGGYLLGDVSLRLQNYFLSICINLYQLALKVIVIKLFRQYLQESTS